MADTLCHTEKWIRFFDDYEEMRSPPWDAAKPWDSIIYNSSYGINGTLTHWWNTRVEHPAGLHPTAARAFLAKTEGLPAVAAASVAHDYGKIKEKGAGRGTQPYIAKAVLAALPTPPAVPSWYAKEVHGAITN